MYYDRTTYTIRNIIIVIIIVLIGFGFAYAD